MHATSAIVLVIDRLGAGWLGPYGNTWLDTPNFNRLAARSVLCETVIADSPDLDANYRAYWTGRHAMQPQTGDAPSLAMLAHAAETHSVLLYDDSRVFEHPLAQSFRQVELVLPLAPDDASEIERTGLYLFFDAARRTLAELTSPSLLWLHSAGMSGPWDAPLELRYQFADEDDPRPPDFVDPPDLVLGDKADPDEVLGYVHAYAGQVALLDLCLGMLLDALDEHPLGHETLLIVTSGRGYPLGEHRRVGPCDEPLYSELLHVPLLVRFPHDQYALQRSRHILQPAEVFSLVADAFSRDASINSKLLRELEIASINSPGFACTLGRDERAIRTPAWFLRESKTDDGVRRELFAKPDDRWEANEVSSRCEEALGLLAAELDRFEGAARADQLAEIPPLAESLCELWR